MIVFWTIRLSNLVDILADTIAITIEEKSDILKVFRIFTFTNFNSPIAVNLKKCNVLHVCESAIFNFLSATSLFKVPIRMLSATSLFTCSAVSPAVKFLMSQVPTYLRLSILLATWYAGIKPFEEEKETSLQFLRFLMNILQFVSIQFWFSNCDESNQICEAKNAYLHVSDLAISNFVSDIFCYNSNLKCLTCFHD